jgi:hypothetical protein
MNIYDSISLLEREKFQKKVVEKPKFIFYIQNLFCMKIVVFVWPVVRQTAECRNISLRQQSIKKNELKNL